MDSGKKKAVTVMLAQVCEQSGLRSIIVRPDDSNPSLDKDISGESWAEVRKKLDEEFPVDEFELLYSDATMEKLFSNN